MPKFTLRLALTSKIQEGSFVEYSVHLFLYFCQYNINILRIALFPILLCLWRKKINIIVFLLGYLISGLNDPVRWMAFARTRIPLV